MEQFIFRHIKKYVKKHFPSEYKEICRRQKEIFPKMMANAPDLGGKENSLAGNLTFCHFTKQQIIALMEMP